ncbi:MAG: hypothetical protein JXJ04_05255 [Spirochaetales bacterium]|nr:hypothetical protein [Spirochaetales bacterium]
MVLADVHDFHFVINQEMKEKLKNLDFIMKSGTLSGIMVKILHVLTPIIGKEHKWGDQRFSKYTAVCDDPEETREHVHMYVPVELYRELKLLHQDLNVYSIAQLVRELLRFFLDLVEVYKNDVFKELEKIFTRWRSEDEETRPSSGNLMRQLWRVIQLLPGKNRLVTVYNTNYSPLWVLRI